MPFDVDTVVSDMLNAAKAPLQQWWQTAAPVAKAEFSAIAQVIAQIGEDRATNTITPDDATDLLSEAKDAAATAMDTQIGLGKLAAQNAINAALAAVSGVVNGYVGFALI